MMPKSGHLSSDNVMILPVDTETGRDLQPGADEREARPLRVERLNGP